MITSISLTNFKCYGKEATFPLSKINLLTGINGKGKSSFLQSLLLFRQSVEHNPNTTCLYLNGSCVNLGIFENVKNVFTPPSNPIKLTFQVNEYMNLHYTFIENSKDSRILLIKDFFLQALEIEKFKLSFVPFIDDNKMKYKYIEWYREENELINDKHGMPEPFKNLLPLDTKIKPNYEERRDIYEELPFKKIHYVSADRLGPQEFYPKNNLGDFIHSGKQGEYVADVLSFHQKQQLTIPNAELALSKDYRLQIQAGLWLSYILDTENVSIILNDENTYINTLSFKMGTKTYTPPNVGFGYSYILPIIVAGLVAKEGEILIIENPEAHLHPRAQSRLTNFLAKVASMGVQVFIESHSDHILNALRVAVKKEDLASDDVQLFYFANDTESSQPKIFMPKIDADGRIEEWPDGFFDEWNNNLMELL